MNSFSSHTYLFCILPYCMHQNTNDTDLCNVLLNMQLWGSCIANQSACSEVEGFL